MIENDEKRLSKITNFQDLMYLSNFDDTMIVAKVSTVAYMSYEFVKFFFLTEKKLIRRSRIIFPIIRIFLFIKVWQSYLVYMKIKAYEDKSLNL